MLALVMLMCFDACMRLSPLKLRRGDRKVLEAWTRSGTVEARVAQRARIVLLAADGRSNRDIGELVDLHYNQVGVWRARYAEFGLAGLDDLERSGRPPVYDHAAWVWSSVGDAGAPVSRTAAAFASCTTGAVAVAPSRMAVPACILGSG